MFERHQALNNHKLMRLLMLLGIDELLLLLLLLYTRIRTCMYPLRPAVNNSLGLNCMS